MVAKSADLFSPRVPRRQTIRAVSQDNLKSIFLLTDKICELPNIVSSGDEFTASKSVLFVYRSPSPLALRKAGEIPFCRIFSDRILIHGLSDGFAIDLVEKGWAVREEMSTMLHMPRDEHEFDICWRIIWSRYRELAASQPERDRATRIVDTPQFSRSNHRR